MESRPEVITPKPSTQCFQGWRHWMAVRGFEPLSTCFWGHPWDSHKTDEEIIGYPQKYTQSSHYASTKVLIVYLEHAPRFTDLNIILQFFGGGGHDALPSSLRWWMELFTGCSSCTVLTADECNCASTYHRYATLTYTTCSATQLL